jgi:hypothetical protein
VLAYLRAHALSHPLLLFLFCLAAFKLLEPRLAQVQRKVAGTFAAKVPATFR